ncbi:MAG: hypothetical protein DA328_01345 [Nitrososphaeraceae archaeon]|nr:hypothetical protein [Nitrososphaeraceae archaeon]
MRQKIFLAVVLITFFSILVFILPIIFEKDLEPNLLISALVMISIFILLSLELGHRTSIVLFATLFLMISSIVLELITPRESLHFIIEAIDFNTIGLLLGMMIIVSILGETGIFNWIGVKATRWSKGNLWTLMLILCIFTAITSMFVDNVTIILLMIPVTISVFKALNISPIPFIVGQTLSSNIGGGATLIGDPPNILIGTAANIDFNSFIIHMGPSIFVSFLVGLFLIRIMFMKDLMKNISGISLKLKTINDEDLIKDQSLLKKSILVLLSVVILFVLQGMIGIEVSVIAMGGAAVLLIITRVHVEKILQEVDWATLLFFAGLFVIVGIMEESGLITLLANFVLNTTNGDPFLTFYLIIWLSAISSGFIDNIPFTATMIPIVESINADQNFNQYSSDMQYSPLWWALAFGADLGGNATLIGSSAGVVAAGMAIRYGYKISFFRWFKIGFPFTIITVFVGSLVLTLSFLLKL